jgi:RNA 2',3'-cyclic 3'-phosphodiesterase
MTDAAPPHETARVFYALVPDPPLQWQLAAQGHAIATRAGGRAIPAANLHLTLAFVGDVATTRLDALRAIVPTLPRQAFALDLNRVGVFRRARVGWLAPEITPDALATLHGALAVALTGASFPLEARPFHPHMTLARRCVRVIPTAACAPTAWHVARVSLMETLRDDRGLRYGEIAGMDFVDA